MTMILADDFSGAHATAALFAGLHPRVRMGLPQPVPEPVAVYDLATRALTAEEAARVIKRALVPVASLALRIDSTGRGHLAAQAAAVLQALPGHRILCVPAYPACGRTWVDGVLRTVGAAPAADRRHPPRAAHVRELLAQPLTHIPLAQVRSGSLVRLLRDAPTRLIVADAETDADIATLAEAVRRLPGPWVSMDPGPFTRALYQGRVPEPEPPVIHPGTWLLVVGSGHALTHRQAALACRARPRPGHALRCLALPQPEAPLDAATARAAARRLAGEVRAALEQEPVAGLIVSGGETAEAVLAALGVQEVVAEALLQPLIALGRLADGRWRGTLLVTKGGLVGEEGAFVDVLRRLGVVE